MWRWTVYRILTSLTDSAVWSYVKQCTWSPPQWQSQQCEVGQCTESSPHWQTQQCEAKLNSVHDPHLSDRVSSVKSSWTVYRILTSVTESAVWSEVGQCTESAIWSEVGQCTESSPRWQSQQCEVKLDSVQNPHLSDTVSSVKWSWTVYRVSNMKWSWTVHRTLTSVTESAVWSQVLQCTEFSPQWQSAVWREVGQCTESSSQWQSQQCEVKLDSVQNPYLSDRVSNVKWSWVSNVKWSWTVYIILTSVTELAVWSEVGQCTESAVWSEVGQCTESLPQWQSQQCEVKLSQQCEVKLDSVHNPHLGDRVSRVKWSWTVYRVSSVKWSWTVYRILTSVTESAMWSEVGQCTESSPRWQSSVPRREPLGHKIDILEEARGHSEMYVTIRWSGRRPERSEPDW